MCLAECEYIDKAENLLITGFFKPHYPINEKLIIWLQKVTCLIEGE
jgi:hypothetical protein